MLRTVGASYPGPGTNLRGAAPAATWRLLLPSLELGSVLIVGSPPPSVVRALSASSTETIVVSDRPRRFRIPRRPFDVEALHPASDDGIRTVALLGTRAARMLGDPRVRAELERKVARDAAIFVMGTGNALPDLPFAGGARGPTLRLGLADGDLCWAAPADDEAMTAAVRSIGSRAHPAGWARRRGLRWLASMSPRAASTEGVGAIISFDPNAPGAGPPAYLREAAREAGLQLDAVRWGFATSGAYASNKAIFVVFQAGQDNPSFVIKMARTPESNDRLVNEQEALSALQQESLDGIVGAPRPIFTGVSSDLRFLCETAVRGTPLRSRTTGLIDLPRVHVVVDRLTELGAASAKPSMAPPADVAEDLRALFDRFVEFYRPSRRTSAFLERQIDRIRVAEGLPLVFQHGDAGTWNVLVTEEGGVGLLDWEAANPHGIPLWDLFYFLRSVGVTISRTSGERSSLRAFEHQFLGVTDLSTVLTAATRKYCGATGVSSDLVEPLFHLCWMHRAVKQASRLSPVRLRWGHYVRLLHTTIEHREAPGLRMLFG
jgi:aminoglycoside phosphotransferase (APT) family kinase protein